MRPNTTHPTTNHRTHSNPNLHLQRALVGHLPFANHIAKLTAGLKCSAAAQLGMAGDGGLGVPMRHNDVAIDGMNDAFRFAVVDMPSTLS